MFQTINLCAFFYFGLLTLILVSAKAPQATAYQAKLDKPPLQLATKYQQGVVVSDYWVSEKLDGVRGYWNGQQLSTRNGNILSPPPWFIKNWPNISMDGEL
jgi:DNA ligase 1